MTDLTVIADVLAVAKPCGPIAVVLPASSDSRDIACPRRQAEPRAVLLMPWPDEVSRPYC